MRMSLQLCSLPAGVDKYIADLDSKGFNGQELVNTARAIAEESNKMTYGTWNLSPNS
jgi:hypothetical protein